MKKVFKWVGIGLGGLIGLIVILIIVLYFVGNARLGTAPQIAVQPLDIPSDEAAVARGEHLAKAISLCVDCHGEDLRGKEFLNEAPIGYIAAPNLTAGTGGVGQTFSDEDWVRAIRHGVGGDGRVLGGMASNAYTHMSDEDLAALIAYLKSVPPVDNALPERSLMIPGTIIFGTVGYGDLPLSKIEHNMPRPTTVSPEVSVEYGEYLVEIGACADCHGSNLAGRIEENGPPPGPNLTPGDTLGSWSEADFFTALRNGRTPLNKTLDPELMPWPGYGQMTDEELQAIWLYLQALPPREFLDND